MKETALKLTLLLGGILIAALLMEGFLRLFAPQIFEVHPPGLYVADPDLGYALTPGFAGQIERPEFKAPFSIGQTGLRGEDPRPYQPQTYRILVLGDSQAFGFGILDEETFSAQLEKLLTKSYPDLDIQVLNGGVPGYGTADQLAFLQARGAELQPDLVIVQFLSVNDLLENRTPASEWAAVQDGWLTLKESAASPAEQLPLIEWLKQWLKQNSHLATLSLDSAGYLATRLGLSGQVDALWGEDFSQADAQLGQELLEQMAGTASQLEAQIIFLYTTGQAQVIQNRYEPLRSLKVVKQAAQQAHVPLIDATARLRQRPDRYQLYYAKDGHWTAAGHQAIAEILAEEIISLQLISLSEQPEQAGFVPPRSVR